MNIKTDMDFYEFKEEPNDKRIQVTENKLTKI
jgi:hypothetical protein